ncbi:MAG: DUF899 domain-containing protein [Drouetiella hepatica Uher 2000/2452]|jgi:predicted dithiol-disulfide oxidoreductase (DUF899 family)|uniref:DUF899 domain-containing protein n=1 Tax=Drouetiella hepatica Uher 2000/2452 TaxID=904376 RepID=A0A951QES5_9CYAN|nr:DUF899 domain-containing protein [Drouetiella hepatica Uher 2000/2452]
MIQNTIAHPNIVGKDEWLTARKTLLEQEKELTQHRDRINAERRRLPMVKLAKEYTFEGADGSIKLTDLFEERTQLIIYHFMFAPEWEKGCMGCTGYVNALGDLSTLNERDTTFVLVSRAPLLKLETYKTLKGWTVPWYSSFGSDFNYDFHVTLDENIAPIEYNYQDKAELEERNGPNVMQGESHGLSVFFRLGEDVLHTYSTYARGVESLTDTYSLLDMTPYGRQEDFEDSPFGYPQKPTYG